MQNTYVISVRVGLQIWYVTEHQKLTKYKCEAECFTSARWAAETLFKFTHSPNFPKDADSICVERY